MALEKAGKRVTPDQVKDIIRKVDTDHDEQISFEEYKAIFALAPDALPVGVKQIVDVSVGLLVAFVSVGSSAMSLLPQSAEVSPSRCAGSSPRRCANALRVRRRASDFVASIISPHGQYPA